MHCSPSSTPFSAHETFTNTYHILSHQTNIEKSKGIEIPIMCSDHNGTKSEINKIKKTGQALNIWELNKYF